MTPPLEHRRTHILAQIGRMAHQPLGGYGIATAILSGVRTPGEPEHGCHIRAWSPRAEDGSEPPTPSPVLTREPELEFLREWNDEERKLFEFDGDTMRAQLRFDSECSCYGTGEVAGPLLRNGRATILWNTDSWCYSDESASLYQSHPHVLVLRPDGSALGIVADTPARGRIETAVDGVELQFEGGPFRLFLIEGPGPAAVQRGLAALIGRIELPPLWALGYHQCRWSYEDQAEVRALVRGFAERGIPLDAIWFDIDYMDRYRVFTWNRERFPDPRALVEELHAQGLHAVAIVDPGLALAEDYPVVREAREGGHLVLGRAGQPVVGRVWPGLCHFPDFSAGATRRWWSGRIRAFLEETPLDGIWNDMNEPSLFRTPTRTLPETAQHAGDGPDGPDPHARVHNLYGQQMAQATHAGVRAVRPDRRPFVLTRSNHLSGSRFSATWTGDNQATWQDLRWSISMALSLGLSGQPFAGPDVGGFHGDPTPELFARWFELGAHLPFFRGHSDKDSCRKEPWSFGPETEALVRAAIERRMRLLPTLYTLFHAASEEGLPVVRPLFWADPADPELRAVDDQFLLGDDLLIAPVVERGATRREVLLPRTPGGWYPLEGGPATLERRLTVDAPLGTTPRFARAGSILVEAEPGPRARTGGDLLLRVYLDPDGRATGRLYEDDGEGYGYREGAYLDRALRVELADAAPRLAVESRGSWQPPTRRNRLRVSGAPGGLGDVEVEGPDGLL